MKRQQYFLTADAIVFATTKEGTFVLLIERKNEPFKGKWAFPGGFLEEDETLLECSIRELYEETGLDLSGERPYLLGVYDKPGRDPRGRVITVSYLFVIPEKRPVQGGDDAHLARWFPLVNLPPLAFDHDDMMRDALAFCEKEGIL